MVGLSLLARGSLAEKLQWVFNLYDVNRDGQITKDEMLDIISSIYDMMGRFAEPCIDDNTAQLSQWSKCIGTATTKLNR